MAVSAIDKELIKYFNQLDESQKKSVLAMIKIFLTPGNRTKTDTSIERYNQELNQAMDRIREGRFTTLEELEKEMQSW